MSYSVQQKFVHMAPRKLRLVADIVRGKTTDEAIAKLSVTSRFAARPLHQAIKAAVNAAKQKHEDGKLYITHIYIDEGPAMKRRLLKSRGRATRMEHRMSHITVTVSPVNTSEPKTKSRQEKE